MSLNHSPQVVTSGLTFYYDMSNQKKSWLGAPTTNLTPNLDIVAIQAAPTLTYIGLEDGWKKYSLNGTWTAGGYPYSLGINAITFTGGVTYSSGVYIKTNVPYKFANLFTGMNYVNEPMNNGGTSFSITQPDGSIYVGRSGFQYTNTTTQTGYLVSNPLVSQVFTSATDFVYIKEGQIEVGAFPTPYVNGTRSNTQTIIDLTSQNTATAGSLAYSSDNTFDFNYASPSYISVPLATALNKVEGTINLWLYPTRYNGGNGYFVNREDASANAVDWLWIGPYSDSFYFRIGNGADCCSNDLSFGSVSTVIPLNNWINMCFTWKANGTSNIYKNGVLYTSRSIGNIPNTNPASNGRFGLGHANGDNYYHGKMPVAQIYNRQLTALEVQQNFNALRGRYSV
jgi:hypothetical protein